MFYIRIVNNVHADVWEHTAEDEGVEDIAVWDTGKRVTVLEWVGTQFSSGQRQAMEGCTLYTDGVDYYTNFDGETV